MSPFSIYAIVLTIALILYYITLITMDLNAKNKKDNKNELTIASGDDTEEDDEEYTPQSVVETSSGSFSFVNNTEAPKENEEIQEAPEEITYQEESGKDELKEEHKDSENQDSESEVQNQEEDKATDQQETTQPQESDIDSEAKDAEKSSEEESANSEEENSMFQAEDISSVFGKETPRKDLSNSELFDENLRTTKYTVNKTFAPKPSKNVTEILDTINNSLENVQLFPNGLMTPEELTKMVRENKENCNIERHDEITML